MFKKGDVVKLKLVVPSGPILSMRMTDEGVVQCLVGWTDDAGVEQQRWFDQSQLVAG
jgi:uncharacterized protein YodC (DUF2158 family)